MSSRPADTNPFDLYRASDYSDAEILDHWVDISEDHGGLLAVIKPRLITPMLLLGGKGSGKTHLMRYCSAPVQAARHGGSMTEAVREEQYIGIYVRAEGLNIDRFADKGQTDDVWSAVFSMYFELWLATNLLTNLRDYVRDADPGSFNDLEFSRRVAALFDADVASEFNSLDELLEYLTRLRRSVDLIVNNCAMTRTLDGLRITFSPGRLVFGIPPIISEIVSELKDTLFVYLIDEAENFTANQQRFLNSLIRYRTGNATIKVGARLYGIRTYETLGSGEPIKQNAEYERVELDVFLRDHEAEYKAFVQRLIQKRLERWNFKAAQLGEENLNRCFAELDSKDCYRAATLEVVNTWDRRGEERPYFKKFRKYLESSGDVSKAMIDEITALLEVKEYPLLEKLNIFLFYRGWPSSPSQYSALAYEIQQASSAFRRGDQEGAEYQQVLRHFDSDLLAQLYRDCRRRIPYSGLNILVHLSQGIPRNLLGVLKHIYRRSLFAGEAPFDGGIISVQSQSEGVMDSAAWFWEDAQPNSHGVEVRESIEALAVLFRTVRYSERPSECDLCSFSVNKESLSSTSRTVLEIAENWSYLIRVRDGAPNKNDQRVDAKFQLSPMLAPRWGLAPHRRGTIELQPELGNALFDNEHRAKLPALFKRRVADMLAQNFAIKKTNQKNLPLL